MRSLHIAALAFPTAQGTQAALHGMLSALGARGHDTHLLCYPLHHDGDPRADRTYQVHRVDTPFRQRSTRSGPSLQKGLFDVALAVSAARCCAELSPDLVVAHHVEAALCTLMLPKPVLFMAHTSLRTELPCYFSSALASVCAAMGAGLDRFLCRRHRGALAVSPLLAHMLSRDSGTVVDSIGVPWQLSAPITAPERSEARTRLGLTAEQPVVLYAGNLDAYQGLDPLFDAMSTLAAARPELAWLVATESSPHDFSAKLAAAGWRGRVLFSALANEADRRTAHAAADLALVPRGAPGGVPVKLLDSLARGLPVVTTRTACAGLPLPSDAVMLVEDFGRWDVAIDHVLGGHLPNVHRGREFIAQAHGKERFVSDLIAHAERWNLLSKPGT